MLTLLPVCGRAPRPAGRVMFWPQVQRYGSVLWRRPAAVSDAG
jgi:hypothetical protein